MPDTVAKEVEILKEAVPAVTRMTVLWDPAVPSHRPVLTAMERAGRVLGVQLSDVVVRSTAEIEGAFSAVDQAGAEAVVVLLGNTFFSRQQLLADLALQHRLPTMFGAREHVAAGGLMSYAANQVDLFRRAATYVDKILGAPIPGRAARWSSRRSSISPST